MPAGEKRGRRGNSLVSGVYLNRWRYHSLRQQTLEGGQDSGILGGFLLLSRPIFVLGGFFWWWFLLLWCVEVIAEIQEAI